MEAAWRAVLRKGARLVCTRWYRPPGCGWEAEVRANSGACRWRWRWTRTCTSSDSSLPTRIRPYRIRGVPMVQTVFRRFSVTVCDGDGDSGLHGGSGGGGVALIYRWRLGMRLGLRRLAACAGGRPARRGLPRRPARRQAARHRGRVPWRRARPGVRHARLVWHRPAAARAAGDRRRPAPPAVDVHAEWQRAMARRAQRIAEIIEARRAAAAAGAAPPRPRAPAAPATSAAAAGCTSGTPRSAGARSRVVHSASCTIAWSRWHAASTPAAAIVPPARAIGWPVARSTKTMAPASPVVNATQAAFSRP